MTRIIAGKTILLNTATNTTFIASEFDESIQTGNRENDQHIEWAGELDIEVMTKEDAQERIESAWNRACEAQKKMGKQKYLQIPIPESNIRLYDFMKIVEKAIENAPNAEYDGK